MGARDNFLGAHVSHDRRRRRIPPGAGGFTLVELLVVIAIIGIMIALLMPSVQSARESGRLTQCKNNLKQFGAAMRAHLATHGFLPSGGWGWRWTGDADRGFGREQPAGWNYSLLPHLDQQNVFDLGADQQPTVITDAQRDGALQRDRTPVAVFVCPTRRQPRLYPRPRGMSYYNGRAVTEAGVIDYAANAGDTNPRWYSGPSSISQALGGSFNWNTHGALGNTGISYARSEIQTGHIRDGESNTYLVGEKYMQPERYADGLDPADDFGMYEGCAHDTYRWCDAFSSSSGRTPIQDRAGYNDVSRFGSPHSAGCNFVFGDGNVRTISFSIAPTTHAAFGNRADGQSVSLGDL